MNSSETGRTSPRRVRRLTPIAAGAILALALAGTALAGLVGGSLPAASFTYTSASINAVNIDGNGIHLKTKGPINVKTTYSIVPPSSALLGWHYHNGPVIVTVTVGTLTFIGGDCQTWDLHAGESYLETTGQVLNALVDPGKNSASAEWFTTRLYPAGAGDPVGVPAPCSL
jgi:hypothetical protein